MAGLTLTIERRYSDLDTNGHVNNVAVMEYLQEARVRLIHEMGRRSFAEESYVVARQEVDYLRPIEFTAEPIVAEVRVEEIGRSSFVISCDLTDEGVVCARARTVMVMFDKVAKTSRPLTDEKRASLEALRESVSS